MADKAAAQALADRLMGRGDVEAGNSAVEAIVAGIATSAGQHPNAKRNPGDGRQENLAEQETLPDDEEESLPQEDDNEIEAVSEDDASTEIDDEPEEIEDVDDSTEELDEEDSGDYEAVTYHDDDTIEVMVDGELQEVSLKDLKAAYSGEGAISKRLKDATELRKAAHAERQSAIEEIAQHRENLARTLGQLDGLIFAPLVTPPDPALRAKDMQQYLMHKDAYEEDQKRIAEGRQQVQNWLGQQHQDTQKRRQQVMQHEQQLLVQAAPELKSKDTASKFTKYVDLAVTEYGFTPEEVGSVLSHKLFIMARDAGKWIAMQKAKDPTTRKETPTGGELKKRKLMKAGNGSASTRRIVSAASQKERQQAVAKAKASGKPDDVAAMLMATAKSQQKGAKRGR